ncbi:MAG: hypothetical protein ACOYB2_03090 [Limnohabitans sp.]
MQSLTTTTLAQLIAAQCVGISATQTNAYLAQKLAGVQSDYVWMFANEPDAEQQHEASLYAVEAALHDTELFINNMHFALNTEEEAAGVEALLAVLRRVHFKACHFYVHNLLANEALANFNFEDCTFHVLWQQPLDEATRSGLVLYKTCKFEQGVELSGDGLDVGYDALFSDCDISQLTLNGLSLKGAKVFANTADGITTIGALRLENCHIHTKFTLDNVLGIESVDILSCEFSKKFAMINCRVKQLDIVNTNFKGLVDFYKSELESFRIVKSIFKDFSGFEDCVFGKNGASAGKIELRYVTFYSFINFRNASFNLPLDLRNTNRDEQPNFLDCKFSKAAELGTDRETYRIIKQSFEAVGNRIEANAFFALEMDAYRRELRENRRSKIALFPDAEEFLLFLNALISRHGQSYGRPLLWLLGTAALFALQQANWPHRWVALPTSLADWLVPVADFLNAWARGLVFFEPLYAKFKSQEALVLLVAVLLSTFTWHLLVAVRRHNRR